MATESTKVEVSVPLPSGERDNQHAVAESLVGRAQAGSSQPLLITGEPGAGKTTLLQSVVDIATRSGFRAIVGTADPADSGVGYAPLRLAMASALEAEDAPALAGLARTLSTALHAVVQVGEPPTEPGRVFEHLRQMFVGWAARQPVLLALDDLHAADPDTTAAISFLVRHVRGTRIFVCVATRIDPPDLDPDTLDTIRRFEAQGVLDVIELTPFDEADLAQLVVTNVGLPPDRSLLAVLSDHTGGNPFFAVELLRELEASDALIRSAHHVAVDPMAQSELPHPRRVDLAVMQRVRRLGADAQAVASIAAVLGSVPEGRLPVLAALTPLDQARSDEAFDTLVRARILVRREGGFRFAHPIVREALYEDLGPATRRRLHHQVAKLLAAGRVAGGTPPVVEIATHARLGATPPDAEAATLLIEAGDAAAVNAPRSAASWYRDALSLLPKGEPAALGTQLELSRALGLSAQHGEAASVAITAMEALPNGSERARAVVLAAHALRWADRYDEAARLLDQALAVPSMRLAALLLHRAHGAVWYDEFALADQLLSEARAIGVDDDDRGLAETVAMHLHFAAGRYDDAFASANRISDRLDRMDPVTRADALLSLLTGSALNGDPRDAIAYAERLDLASTMPDWSGAVRSWALYRMGRWEDAAGVAWQALGAVDPDDAPNLPAVGVLIAARAEQGDFVAAEAARKLGDGIAGNRKFPDWAGALLAMYRGRYDLARQCLEPLVRSLSERGRSNFTFPLALQAQAAWRSGDHAAARDLNVALQALPSHASAVAHTVACLITQALVNRDADAADAASACAADHGLAADAALALGLLGAIRDDADRLIEAYHALDELGAVIRQRDVVHHLRRLGRRPPRQRRSANRLTARELELARLVARGLSNRQIAQAAHLSLRTVEVYLSRIYAKSGCGSRVDLAVAMTDGRLGEVSERGDDSLGA